MGSKTRKGLPIFYLMRVNAKGQEVTREQTGIASRNIEGIKGHARMRGGQWKADDLDPFKGYFKMPGGEVWRIESRVPGQGDL